MPASLRSPKRDTAVASNGAPAAYQQLHGQFSWKVPKRFNMAAVCAARWARAPDSARRIAIRSYQEDGSTQSYSYAQLQTQDIEHGLRPLLHRLITPRLRPSGETQTNRQPAPQHMHQQTQKAQGTAQLGRLEHRAGP
jgi:hypothetical protein